MLNQMRRSASGVVTKLLLGLLVLSFVVWGITDFITAGGTGNTVLRAGDTRVSVASYQTAYGLGLDQVAQRLQRRPTAQEGEALGVDQAVLSQLAAGAILDEEARRAGVNVSEEGLIGLIQEEPAFRGQDGAFSRNVMRSVLQNARMTEAGYLADLSNSARRTQIVGAISDGADIPDAFVDALGRYGGERRTVSYATLQPPSVDTIPNPSADELDDFFTERRDDYRTPEYRSFRYVLLSPDELARPQDVTAEAIATFYESNRERFTTPERRQVRQAVFADRAQADDAAAAIAGGTSFEAAMASANVSIADLGLVPRSAIPNPVLAEAAFGAEAGQPTDVVDGPFGPVILEVARIDPPVTRSLQDAGIEIRSTLAANAANEAVANGYNAMQDALGSGATLEEAAQQSSLPLVAVPSVDRSGLGLNGNAVSEVSARPEVVRAAFAAEPGAPVEPTNIGQNGYAYVEVGETTEPRDQELSEVEGRVIQTWKEDEAQRLVEERAANLADRVRGGQSLGEIASAEGLTVQIAPAITRESGPAEIGEAATRAAFSGGAGTVANAPARESGQAVVLRVDETSQPMSPLAEVAAPTRDSLDAALREDLFQSYVSRAQSEIPVTYDVGAIQQAKSAVR